jgi:hypothetical protein
MVMQQEIRLAIEPVGNVRLRMFRSGKRTSNRAKKQQVTNFGRD